MPCEVANCSCRTSPEAKKLHDTLTDHSKGCDQCRAAHGKNELCEEGRRVYVEMAAAIALAFRPGGQG